MIDFLIEWAHTYFIHLGAWVAFACAATVTKNGLPEPKQLKSIFVSAFCMAAIVAVFSSHAHSHYISHFVSK